jgi:hypothetical protein
MTTATINRSYRDVGCSATISVDPGSAWCTAVAREGTEALNSIVVGLHPYETMSNDERWNQPLNDFGLWLPYHRRACDAVEQLWDAVWPGRRDVRVVVEGFKFAEPGEKWADQPRIPLVDAMPVREQITAVGVRFPGAFVLPRAMYGGRHQVDRGGPGGRDGWKLYYGPELVGARPSGWLPSERPKGSGRIDEQACYDLAAVLELWLAAGSPADFDAWIETVTYAVAA